MGVSPFRLGKAKLWIGIALLALPAVYACATGETGEEPEGGFPSKDGGTDGKHPRKDGAEGDDGGSDEGSTDGGGGGCVDGSQCCTSAQCPPTAHVVTTNCMNGSCGISTCTAGWYDFDASYAKGCNCQESTNGTSCATATVVPPLTLGSSTTVSGNLPTSDGENWFQISFTGAATDKTYHPEITFTTNPENEFVIDVAPSCSGAPLSCGDVDAAASVTTWEEFYASKDAGTVPSEFKPIAPVGAGGVVLVRVHRANPGSNCDGYELTISD
jgi:hypothetical protein